MRAYFHCFAINDWRRIVGEFFTELATSGLLHQLDEVRVGVVGTPAARAEVREFVTTDKISVFAEADEGWEQVTLIPMCYEMRRHRLEAPGMGWRQLDEPVLYSHSKGVWRQTPENERWRAAMLRHLVTDWKQAVSLLDAADVVGSHRLDDVWPYEAPHWLGHTGGRRRAEYELWRESSGAFEFDPDDSKWQGPGHRSTTVFAGNWWWTTAGWLAQMPLPGTSNRFEAEHWVASTPGHRPRVVDVEPGWPKVLVP